jgi:hypothetical protein
MRENEWYLVSSHGSILFYVAAKQDCTIRDIAEALCLTRRTVWGIVGDLRRAGMILVRKNGRRHHYSVNLDGPFRHPTIKGYALRHVLGAFIKWSRRNGGSASQISQPSEAVDFAGRVLLAGGNR